MSSFISTTLEKIINKEKGSLISGPFGSNISSKYFVDEGVPVIRGNNLTTNQEKFIDSGFVFITQEKAKELNCYAVCNDLIFTAAGTIGQVGVIPSDTKYQMYTISNKQIRARLDKEKIDILFAYYWFSSPWIRKRLINSNKGTTVPLLTLSEIKDLPIKYPVDLKKQYQLAHVIDVIDKKIALNNRIIAVLGAMSKTIYDYWFVQFDFPNDEGKPYRQSGGEMEYNETLKREIPKGWRIKPLSQLGDFKNGINYDKDTIGDKDYKIVNVRNISETSILMRTENMDTISLLSKNADNYLVSERSILIARSGIPGATRIISGDISNSIYCGFIICFSPFTIENKYYLTYVLKGLENNSSNASSGTILKNVSQETLKMINVTMPTELVIKDFNNIIQPIMIKITMTQKENLELTRLRDWLLPMLMNGQARVD